jgi:hypothetical protein
MVGDRLTFKQTFPVKSENPCTPPEAAGEIKTLTFEKLII